MPRIKLSEWAKDNGVSYQTALRYWHKDILDGEQLPTGSILVNTNKPEKEINQDHPTRATVYARVSSNENKNNAKTQSERAIKWCEKNGYIVNNSVIEVGSGLNDNRPKLNKLLKEQNFDVLVIEHKDRITRFGFEYIKILLENNSKQIIVINEVSNDEDDLMQDFVSLVTSFCARIYGKRRSKRIIEKLIAEVSNE